MRYKITNSMLADGLTKAVNYIKHLHFCNMVGLEDMRVLCFMYRIQMRLNRLFVIRRVGRDAPVV